MPRRTFVAMTQEPKPAGKTWDATRPGEVEAPMPAPTDAALVFIGRIRTPFATRDDCPRQGRVDGPVCRIEVDEPWRAGLLGLGAFTHAEVLYWMHLARRDLIVQNPKSDGRLIGTFALRSPVRPNPVALSRVEIVAVEDGAVLVRGLDCVDGTPLIDIKPDRCAFTPQAAPKPGVEP
jgi:tRNA-Thr(GGU) m(6)t(6)A37 methyltransferase TsaA